MKTTSLHPKIGKGCTHIYTGNGKGKTTAALGLALRAAGSGLRVRIVQLMKGRHYSELDAVRMLEDLVIIEQYGRPEFCRITDPPDPEDVGRAHSALDRLHALMDSHACDIIVADEIVTAVKFGLLSEAEVLGLIRKRPEGMELILTGRGATGNLIDAADLVTEMLEIKHYYQKGINARQGIES